MNYSNLLPDWAKPILLAFKPFQFTPKKGVLSPLLLPDYEWPKLQVVTSPCPLHQEPVENCTCGVWSTFDFEEVKRFCSNDVDFNEPTFPVMGVIQVLGYTVVEGYTLRSWGAFLWGLVKPDGITIGDWRRAFVGTPAGAKFYEDFNPVMYYDSVLAIVKVKPTLIEYELLEGEEDDEPY